MLVLFPSDPFETYKPDPDWAEEARIAQECGHEVAYVHHESLVNDDDPAAAVKKVPEQGETVRGLYRGWMLTSDQYEKLHGALMRDRGVDLITSPEEYARVQNMPEWMRLIEGGTPQSVVLPMHRVNVDSVTQRAIELLMRCPHGIVIKDFVKSRKHEWEDACFIPTGEDAKRVIGNFLERQGDDLQGGVVLREFIPLKSLGPHPQSGMPMSEEFRFFWLNGHVAAFSEYWPSEAYEMHTVEWPEPEGGWEDGMERTAEVPKSIETLPAFEELAALVDRVGVPFFTMDLAQKEDGEWIVMELGDGGVSAFPQMPHDAQKFYPSLDPLLSHGHVHDEPEEQPDLTPVTRVELDPLSCAVEGCDHSDHEGGVILSPRCHVGSPTWCSYEDGAVSVACATCKRVVARIAVDPGKTVH
jgi:hypothetical protein